MGLFDFESPSQVRQNIKQENIATDASRGALTGWQAIGAAAYGGGRGLGQALGGEDPRITKAQKLQEVQQSMFNEGWEGRVGTPEFYQEAARRIQSIDPKMAMQALEKGREMEVEAEKADIDRRYKEASITNLTRPKESKPGSAIGKLVSDRKNNIINDEEYRIGLEKLRSSGQTINVNTGSPALQKPTISKLEESIKNTTEGIDRLDAIGQQFSPRFLTTPNRALMEVYNQADKWNIPLGADSQKELAESSQFLQDSINNINLYIKYITGAQMSYQEADRLRLAAPDPGEGIFGKDGPTKFKAKLDNAIKGAKLARMRAVYIRQKGLSVKEVRDGDREDVAFPVSLTQMQSIYDERGEALERQMKKDSPGMDESDIVSAVRAQLKEEFGM